MKNRILAAIMVILVILVIFTAGVNFQQQREFLRERTALTTELTEEKERSKQELLALQKETKTAFLLKNTENDQLRGSVEYLNAKLLEGEGETGKLLSKLNDSEFRLRAASRDLNLARGDAAKLRTQYLQLQNDWFYLRGEFEDTKTALKSLENYAFEDAEIKIPTVSIKPILFIPKDYDAPKQKEDLENIGEGLKIVQSWFLKRVGATFKFSDPVVFKGKKTLAEYETNLGGYSQSQQANMLAIEVAQEIQRHEKGYYFLFLYGKISTNWAQFFDTAVVGDTTIDSLRTYNYGTLRYAEMGLIAHELGHLLGGLPDVISNNGSIMSNSGNKMIYSNYNFKSFPNIDFTTVERETLRMYLK